MSARPKDAIVVLGCRVSKDGRAQGALLRRCQRAAVAFHDGLGPLVVACGGKRWHGHAEASVMRKTLCDLGVPGDRVVCELHSTTTWGNAQYGAAILRTLGARRIAVVTCDFHQGRALALFARAGFDTIGLACSTPQTRGRRLGTLIREAVLRGTLPGVS
jgi:SanA protein